MCGRHGDRYWFMAGDRGHPDVKVGASARGSLKQHGTPSKSKKSVQSNAIWSWDRLNVPGR